MAKGEGRGVVLGYLRYVLGLDNLEFQEGLADSDKRLKVAQKSLQKTADKIKGVGAILSVGVTAPIVGVGAAFAGMAKEIAGGVPELQKAAQLANTNFVEFQKLAFAAKSVNIESDKLSDIYKDVTDRVGEFLQTGGGEMKDFFTTIGPKVGVTAEQFRNLSGPQALQLYYDSLAKAGLNQQQMTFYMEAMADEATGLIPLLANNGALMKELGANAAIISPEDAERMKQYVAAQRDMDAAFQNLTISLVKSGLLEQLTAIISKVTEWAGELAKTNPEILKWGVVIGGIAAAVGPVVLGIGGLVSGFSALLPVIGTIAAFMTTTLIPNLGLLLTALAPILLPLAAVAAAVGAVYLAWKNWDAITGFVQRLYQSVKTWLMDRLGAVFDWLGPKIEWVANKFKWLDDVVVRHSYIPDMVDSIGQHMRRLQQEMVDPATKLTQTTAEKFRDMASRVGGIMDELYPKTAQLREEMAKLIALQNDKGLSAAVRQAAIEKQIGRVLNAQDAAQNEVSPGLGNIEPVAGLLEDAYAGVAKAGQDAAKQIAASNDNAGQSFVDMANTSLNALSNLAQAIKGGGILDILSSAFNAFGSIAKSGLLGGKLSTAFSAFTGISGFRANGGPVEAGKSYVVGERRAELFTPSRSGYIHPSVSDGSSARPSRVEVVPSAYFDVVVDGRAAKIAAPMSMQAASAGSNGAQVAIARSGSRRIP
ncbi:hypothetical protein [Sphingobium yanoikuyae]|uniref:hypothetical protein n=1 Tax=Sphingobium yanoikuyae TaxID=13690 RepID=UPI00191782D2|nr:hypothetical protein [Sphingobium yanoikuyae]